MNVLSLFNGMSCGLMALEKCGIRVNRYYSSEIDKPANRATQALFPYVEQLGDVTKWRDWGVDFSSIGLVTGGFPCQAWSMAGKQLGDKDERGKLFWTMLDIMKHIKFLNPKVKFLIENVKMKRDFEEYITKHTENALGHVDKILINSALVSAQNRNRYYWTNIQGVGQPEDRGVLLKDIIDFNLGSCNVGLAIKEKSNTVRSGGRGSPFGGKHEWDSPYVKADKKLGVKNNLGKASCLTGGANSGGNHSDMDILVVQTPRGFNKGGVKAKDGKTPTLSSCSWEQNNKLSISDTVRRFTPRECMRLQTVPEHHIDTLLNAGISNTQLYKMTGNAWTVDVIAHILNGIKKPRPFLSLHNE